MDSRRGRLPHLESREEFGELRSLRGEKRPSDERRTSLTLLGSPVCKKCKNLVQEKFNYVTFELVPGNDISVSLSGEKSCEEMESLLERPGDGECRTRI